MEPQDYVVKDIKGEYAILENLSSKAELIIAMALLPLSIDIGTKLHYENLEYKIIK